VSASLLAVLAALATLLLLALRATLGALALTERALTVLLGAARSAATATLLFLSISEHFLEYLSEIRHFYIIMRDIFYAK
jgi:hypothetical protein